MCAEESTGGVFRRWEELAGDEKMEGCVSEGENEGQGGQCC